MLCFIEEYSRLVAIAFKMVHDLFSVVLNFGNRSSRNEQPHMNELHHLIHAADLVVKLFKIGKLVFRFDLLLHIFCIHNACALFGHGVVDILLDLLLIFGFNIYRHDHIINIDDLRQPELVYVFRVAVDMQYDLIAVTGFDELFIAEGYTALWLNGYDEVLVLL